jgi:hypothetical protein
MSGTSAAARRSPNQHEDKKMHRQEIPATEVTGRMRAMHPFLPSLFATVILALGLSGAQAQDLTPAEAREIARDAYIYGFPIVDGYRVQYSYFENSNDPSYRAPWNTLYSVAGVYTPEDTAVQTPNSDTPYSFIGMDLRTEPMVLVVPPIEENRYFSIQLIDVYTHNFAYVGSRTTGNGGGNYLIAGPTWEGETPDGITAVLRSETEFVLGIYRTQLLSPTDLDNVITVQAGYEAVPLSAFAGQPAPAAAPAIDFIEPLTPEEQRTSLEFYSILNFFLQFAPTVPSEVDLMERFGRIGVGPGMTFDPDSLSPEIRDAIMEGMSDAGSTLDDLETTQINTGQVTSGDLFGTREALNGPNHYLYRFAGAKLGIYGNTASEAVYPFLTVDSDGNALSGANNYTLHFAADAFPPVNAFWSATMYELPSSLLVANSINRYLINSPMLPDLTMDTDGGLTIYVQNESPGPERESNWLPAPMGPFFVALRLYWPQDAAFDGSWTPPTIVKVE